MNTYILYQVLGYGILLGVLGSSFALMLGYSIASVLDAFNKIT